MNILERLKKTYEHFSTQRDQQYDCEIKKEFQIESINNNLECEKYIDEMIENNVVIGVYYSAILFDEIRMNEEAILLSDEDNKINFGHQAFSIIDGSNLIIIQDNFNYYDKYYSFDQEDTKEVIAVYKDVKWNNLSKRDIFYIYNLYQDYIEYKKTQEGYQKRK